MLQCLAKGPVSRDLLREAQRVAFTGPFESVWNVIHLQNPNGKTGYYRGYHGTNLSRVLDQVLKGAFDPGRRIYVADPWELHIALNYSHEAVSCYVAPHTRCFDPDENVCLPQQAELCGVVLGISSDTSPVSNEEGDCNRDSRFKYFPPGSEVYINDLFICHPRLRFAESFDDNYGGRRLSTRLFDCPSSIRKSIPDADIIPLIKRIQLFK